MNANLLEYYEYGYNTFFTLSYKRHSLCEKCPNTGKYRPEKTPYLDSVHPVIMMQTIMSLMRQHSKYHSRKW